MEEKSKETLYDKTISILKLANREKMNDRTDRERKRERVHALYSNVYTNHDAHHPIIID